MKNVTITLSNDLLEVLDNLYEDCNLSRYAFTKEALLEKIERHLKNNVEEQQEDSKKGGVAGYFSGDITIRRWFKSSLRTRLSMTEH